MTCLFGHKFIPFEYSWVEHLPNTTRPSFNKDGRCRVLKVYCARCGEIREVVVHNGRVRYQKLPEK